MLQLGLKALLAFLLAGAVASGPALAKNDGEPGSKGQGHSKGKGKQKKHFSDENRSQARDYYVQEYRQTGNCPPGLAKKNNGCLPPGQAKKLWAVGQPLPREVYYEALPPELVIRLSPAPAGYQYVRVASDILMLAVGTRMVMGALADLSRL